MGTFGSPISAILLFLLLLFLGVFFLVHLVVMRVMIQVSCCCTNFAEEEHFVFWLLALLGV